jgi:hypothetical protein
MAIFHNYEDILSKKIIIKKSTIFSEKYWTKEIKYKIKNPDTSDIEHEDLYIQTPFILIKYLPKSYEGSIDSKISFDIPIKIPKEEISDDSNDIDMELKAFYGIIKRIHKILKTKLIKKENEALKGIKSTTEKIKNQKKRNKYIECFKEKENRFDEDYKNYNLKTKVHSLNGKPYLKIYNSNRKLNFEQKLKPNTLTRFIIHLESIWYFEDTYGFNWYTVQAEIKLPNIPLTYSFHNSSPLLVDNQYDVPRNVTFNMAYDKYHKMKKMGIPIPAIKNKIKLDGLTVEIFEKELTFQSNQPSIPPPPPPPPPLLLNSVKLKKVEVNIKKQEVKKDNEVSLFKKGFVVPTADELQNQLSRLKKTPKKNKDEDKFDKSKFNK